MSPTVQARLDEETQATLKILMRRHGWSPSQAVREGIKLLAQQYLPKKKRKIIGQGEFDAGPSDLSTNKKYMEGFGRD